MVIDPGHFHAALIQREMYPGISPEVSVFAPLGPELIDYLSRVSLFNNRKESPTAWELNIQTGDDPMARMVEEHPGNVAVFTAGIALKSIASALLSRRESTCLRINPGSSLQRTWTSWSRHLRSRPRGDLSLTTS